MALRQSIVRRSRTSWVIWHPATGMPTEEDIRRSRGTVPFYYHRSMKTKERSRIRACLPTHVIDRVWILDDTQVSHLITKKISNC